MRKGLLVCGAKDGKKKNIGDYVQSVAGEQYTGHHLILIQREQTHEYKGEPVKMIMNSWWMHFPENWPPSENILPLFTSIHMNPDNRQRMLSEKGVEYFKEYVKNFGPVGARDRGTEKLLKSKGIAAYFSGCLTLTLGKTYKHDPKSENICFVDAHHQARLKKNLLAQPNNLFTVITKGKTISKICNKLYKSGSFTNLLRAAQFYRTYSAHFEDELLENAEYTTHILPESQFKNEEAKLECARDLLSKYAKSRLVVTSRIHAALPCLGIVTPVIFVLGDDLHPNGRGLQPEAKGRFDGLLDLFHVMENVNYKLSPILGFKVDEKIGINHSIRNKQHYLKLAEKLDEMCTAFMSGAKMK